MVVYSNDYDLKNVEKHYQENKVAIDKFCFQAIRLGRVQNIDLQGCKVLFYAKEWTSEDLEMALEYIDHNSIARLTLKRLEKWGFNLEPWAYDIIHYVNKDMSRHYQEHVIVLEK